MPARLSAVVAILCGALVLAACASPRERCVARATQESRTVEGLIASVEANLARGYAIDSRPGVRTRLDYCNAPDGTTRLCPRNEPVMRREAVAIDVAAEKRKLDGLRERRARLLDAAREAERLCAARYPSD